jgi:Fe2+ or Zn2+ uptake regulation protein
MTKEAMIHQMRASGLKITPQRLAILDALIEKQTLHPSARAIFQEAKRRTKGLSLSTVYYTLNELSKHGIIKTLEFDRMENRYEGILADHINLICKQCHAIIDHPFSMEIDTEDIARKKKFWVTETRVEYYGYCQKCIQGRTRPAIQNKPPIR